jgi:RNA polymerase sigma factor (sigma-70 family)
MTKSKSVPAIPAKWSRYIKRSGRLYAVGMFSPEDAEQTAFEAFIRAKARYVPTKGAFENYAKAAIRNALLNARVAEQRHWEIPTNPDGGGGEEVPTPPFAAEDEALRAMDEAEKARAVVAWTDRLPATLSTLYHGLYAGDLSQREFAAQAGVSQAAVSQRNQRLLHLAEDALSALAAE